MYMFKTSFLARRFTVAHTKIILDSEKFLKCPILTCVPFMEVIVKSVVEKCCSQCFLSAQSPGEMQIPFMGFQQDEAEDQSPSQ